jgi:hypothetical protein
LTEILYIQANIDLNLILYLLKLFLRQ